MAVRSKSVKKSAGRSSARSPKKTRYARKALMYATLANGGHLQVHEILDGRGRKLGITATAVQEDRRSPWVVKYSHEGKDYDTFKEALKARRNK